MKTRDEHNLNERLRKKREKESFQTLSSILNLSNKCSKKEIIDAAVKELLLLRQVLNQYTAVTQDAETGVTHEKVNEKTHDDSTEYFFENPLDRYLESVIL